MLSEMLLPENVLSAPLDDFSYMLLYKTIQQTNKLIGAWHSERAINFAHEFIRFAADFVKRGRL